MPRLKLTLPPPETPWMKTPLVLVDHLMPHLKDTELRILLLLLRRTQFRSQKSERPLILPYRLLISKTGRQSEAISKAIVSLSQQGLIHTNRPFVQRSPDNPNKHPSQAEEQQI